MSSHNQITRLPFSGRHITADVVTDVKNLPLDGRVIVVNLGTEPAYLVHEPRTPIPALSSTTAVDSTLEQASAVALLRVTDTGPVATITGETGWQHFADIAPAGAFPRSTPLYRSLQADVGTVHFDPRIVLGDSASTGPRRPFRIRLMLWFAPSGTSCGIHNEHGFIETHAQIAGHGRMQKFRSPDRASLYEDIQMSPGYATPVPFCGLGPRDTFSYPWHQYHADTDCVWLAVEYHLAD